MQVTITGGAGFIGHHLVRALAARGHTVVVLDNLRRGSFEQPGMELARCITGDVRSFDDCLRALDGSDAVVHLAAQSNVMGSQDDPGYTYETNVSGTWNVARAAAEQRARQFVFASSREVYGEPAGVPVPETAPLAARNLYGASKAAGETLLRALPWPLPAVAILRLANVYGLGDAGRVIPLWVEAGRRRRPLTLFGGTQVLDFVPVAFVCDAMVRVLEQGGSLDPVNIGTGLGTTLHELAARICGMFETGCSVELKPAREVEVTRFVADVSRMRSVLGLVPPTDPLELLAELRDVEA